MSLPGSKGKRALALVPACILVSVALCAPSTAGACASLQQVKSFQGHASALFQVLAAGQDPESGGSEAISLMRRLSAVKINLNRKTTDNHGRAFFSGEATGGAVKVGDVFENTGTDLGGTATFEGPLPANAGGSDLVFDHKKCEYKFHLGFILLPQFEGDAVVNPGPVGGEVSSDAEATPGDLKIKGVNSLTIEPSCSRANVYTGAPGCAGTETAWMGDVVRLSECHSLETSGCSLDENGDLGSAVVNWQFTPTFFKHKKK